MNLHKHKIFVSYYHEDDQQYKEELVGKYGAYCFWDHSVDTGEIDDSLLPETIRTKIRDEYLRDTTVTIVLLGANTHKRKHIDWEIASSLIDSKTSHKNGLLGILLPTHSSYNGWVNMNKENTQKRFLDNYQNGYANLIKWKDLSYGNLLIAIEQVFVNRQKDADHSEVWKKYNS